MGYDDDLDKVYRYDSFVPNHKQMAEGDLLILCDHDAVLRVAQVTRLVTREGSKEFRRCPECNIATIKVRSNTRPPYRCKAGHAFDTPILTYRPCTQYEAHFDGTCRKVPERIPVEQVRQACLKYNGQLAIQRLDLTRLRGDSRRLVNLAESVRDSHQGIVLFAHDASEDPYVLDEQDKRELIARQIRARRGQAAFRQALRKRFGDTCVVTGCRLPDLLEAAHISPYRGVKDHHRANGLLLRADIHTLFDLDLLGIDPDTLQLSLHPKVQGMGYDHLAGNLLGCKPGLVSREALKSRWDRFRSKLP
ncbi:HNH endonuclease [Hyalangium versicolor]|uniref:HNH endonuclease n=1 Tax=Hyalangium versicolor TaxID=2861190 RepID=UPI001CC91DBA|nr:HNH endonuclease signature motif containing protein [Hyalangium versicolor]